MNRSLKYILSRESEDECVEIEVTVQYEYISFCRGTRINGIQIDPDDLEDVEIELVVDEKGNEITLTDEERMTIEEKCLEAIHVDNDGDYVDYMLERMEDR